MEFSTFIVLLIAVFIIVYRVKTWNDVPSKTSSESEIVEEVVEYKVDEISSDVIPEAKKKDSKPKAKAKKASTSKTTAKKIKSETKKIIKKSLKADQAKNKLLLEALSNTIQGQKVLTLKSQPKSGITTLITLSDSFTEGERAVGLVYEKKADTLTIIKSFDVKMGKEQFKISTSFSKSLSVKISDMKKKDLVATHYLVKEGETALVADVKLTLK